ncbi:BtrH N-terminal domain-containing protein [Crocinitomix catalasitica]|uniref:BtrH N-terminal domain-containing protein n=1 Tax=Crocinitomix catalasitica TaxID=184607 RepID=UPI000488AF69|nr:BtrH N-terminal domain-containing protein [Crocinitomix catalasitica]
MEFKHVQTAHCENGVIVGLLKHQGVNKITEPLAFGLGSGLFYIHIPFLKIQGGPAIAFRSMPGSIFKRTCKTLNIEMNRKKFNDPKKGEQYLNKKLAENIPVGCQAGVFHLDYFADEYRFHFNAHNLIVYGRNETGYLVSDPVMEDVTTLSYDKMERARFAKGALAPKGHLYYPSKVNEITDAMIRNGIVKGIKHNVRDMLDIPGKLAGVKGIGYTAGKVRKLREKGQKEAGLYLGQIIRMQEEIGTGGGGFRFLYAAFLEEAVAYMHDDRLLAFSEKITKAGDLWRDSAVQMAGVYKGRLTAQSDYDAIADLMLEIKAKEFEVFSGLRKLKLK